MSDKTYVFENGENSCSNSGMMGLIASLCQNRGLDPNMVAAMMNNRGGYGDGQFGWFWIIILLIFGWGGFGGYGGGFGGRGNAQGFADLGNLVNNDAGRELLMNAIQGNANAIGQLSTKLGCDYNSLNAAIQNLSTQMCQLGNTIGLGQRDIIAAIQNGNQSILTQLCDCCCQTQRQIADFKGDLALQNCQNTNALTNSINFVNSSVERGFAAEAYERQSQTCTLQNAIEAQSRLITDKFAQLEQRELLRENQNLRDQLAECRLSDSQQAQTATILNQLQPVAKPAYVVQSPYQSQMFPFYGFNPYGWNGCCGNNNSGCGY